MKTVKKCEGICKKYVKHVKKMMLLEIHPSWRWAFYMFFCSRYREAIDDTDIPIPVLR